MQKLGILASILLLTAAIIGPVGISFAQTVDTQAASKAKHDEGRQSFDQMRADRLDAQKQKAADLKAKMNAKKMEAAKAIEAAIAARADAIKKSDIPRAADILAELKAQAADAIAAKAPSGAPSDSQVDLEKQRESFAMKVKDQKSYLPKAPAKDLKVAVDVGHKVPKTQKDIGAIDQKAKEEAQKAEADKADEIKKKKYGSIHYNRK